MANNVLASMSVIIGAQTAQFNRALSQSSNQLNKFSSNITSTAKQLVAGFGLLEVGKQLITVTGEFQRFQAVLSNTLGSDSAANRALTNIKDFASKTPFAVNELTGSFVKLANQGFKPTNDQLTSLGDLASSTGKSFDQLTEAIIDAQTGEFERLKEFGIRARKNGNDVSFTFKGVTQTVKNTSQSIRDYILSLGAAEGVAGSMSKISETLEGRISNLGDAWDNFLLTLGKGSKGPIVGAVNALTNLANAASHAKEELEINNIKYGFKSMDEASTSTLDYITDFLKANSGKKISDIISPVTSQNDASFFLNLEENAKKFTSALEAEGEQVIVSTTLWKRYVERRLEAKKANNADDINATRRAIEEARKSAEAFVAALTFDVGKLKTINEVQAKIKLVTEIRDSGTGETLDVYNNKLEDLNERLKELQNYGLNQGIIGNIQNQIAKLEKLRVKNNNIFDFVAIDQQIEKLRAKLSVIDTLITNLDIKPKTGEDFLRAFGLDEKGIGDLSKRIKEVFNKIKVEIVSQSIEIGGVVASAITDIASAIGEGLGSGNFDNFGDNLLKAVGNFMKQLGALMISLGTAKAVLQFSNNPYLLIAAGAALVVAGAAISSLTAKQGSVVSGAGALGSGSGSGGRVGGSSGSGLRDSDKEIRLSGEFTVRGTDLVYVFDKQKKLDVRTRG